MFHISVAWRINNDGPDFLVQNCKREPLVRDDQATTKSLVDIVNDLTLGVTSNGHIIYGDKFFGHLDTLKELKQLGFDSVMNFSKIRPKVLWNNVLKTEILNLREHDLNRDINQQNRNEQNNVNINYSENNNYNNNYNIINNNRNSCNVPRPANYSNNNNNHNIINNNRNSHNVPLPINYNNNNNNHYIFNNNRNNNSTQCGVCDNINNNDNNNGNNNNDNNIRYNNFEENFNNNYDIINNNRISRNIPLPINAIDFYNYDYIENSDTNSRQPFCLKRNRNGTFKLFSENSFLQIIRGEHHFITTGSIQENLQLYPFTIAVSKNTVNNTQMRLVSTVHGMEEIISTEEHQSENGDFLQIEEKVPLSRFDYFKHAGNVDKVNRNIHNEYYDHKISRWRVTLIIWWMKCLVHNTQIIYQNITNTKMSSKTFIEKFISSIVSTVPLNQSFILEDHFNAIKRLTKPKNCRYCYMYTHHKSTCHHICTKCQIPLHLKCSQDLCKHAQIIIDVRTERIKKLQLW